MAANQTSNHKHRTDNNRKQASQPMPKEFQREESESSYGSMGDMAQQASDYVSESAGQMQECIRDRPVSSVMVALVAGFGIGLIVGKVIGTPQSKPRSRRYREMAEGFGSRLMDRIEALVPDAVADHFSK
jgi:ElaB/YqjD/DUF883 family membrane-anchored ribosome-binding protein